MIIGCCGAGKSTLARRIHEITQLPLIHLDQHYWKPNWIESEKEEWKSKVAELVQGDTWIIDGNYGGTMDIRMQKADTIVFLDRGKWLCLYRVLKRIYLNYGKTRADMTNGCPERLDFPFLHYVYSYNTKKKPALLERLAKVENKKQVFVLKSDKAVEDFLKKMAIL